jgi:hypothetical protein
MSDAKSESEEPPGRGGTSRSRANVSPIQSNDQHRQAIHRLNRARDFAQVSCFIPAGITDLSAAWLFCWNVPSYPDRLITSQVSYAFPLQPQLVPLFRHVVCPRIDSFTLLALRKSVRRDES